MRTKLIKALGTIALAGSLSVAQAEQIVLNDGSRIQGKVLSMENGRYTIQTGSMGVIRLEQSEIRSISSDSGHLDSQIQQHAAEAGQSAVQSLQSSMVNNPGIMSSIMSLQNDPDMQAVLQDPEVMRAIQNFDLETLRNHPKIQKLMQNRKIRDIQGKVN